MTNSIDFEAVFSRLPTPYVLVDPAFQLVAMNQAYLDVTRRKREDSLGRNMFDAFPAEGEPRRMLEESLRRVIDERRPDTLALIRYAIARPASEGGGFEDRWWSASHTPVFDDKGDVALIIQHTQDVTELQRLRDVALGSEVLRRAQTVQAEGDQLRRMFMAAPGFMALLTGPEHRFEMVNRAYAQLIGHRDVVGLPLAEALPEVIEQGFGDLLTQVRDTGEAFVGQGVKVLLQRNRGGELEERYVDFIYQPLTEADGSPRGVIVQGSDVTEQFQARERQQVLLDELNHRVKNTLATVQAISAQTLRRAASPQAFAEAFEARLLALSKTHNALTEGAWEGADLGQILRQELAPYAPDRILLSGSTVHLHPRAALALGMVFHELATNAAKYGALSETGRGLSVSWRVDGAGAARRLTVDWEEQARDVVAPDAHGFGSRLIQRSIEGELGGTLRMDWRPEGLVARFTAPLAE